MSKDRRDERRSCLRCGDKTDQGSELCESCEEEAIEEMVRYDDPLDQERADSMVGE
jgi:hypothetical protein